MRAHGTADSFRLAGIALASAAIATAVGLVGCSSTAGPPGGATSSPTKSSGSATSSAGSGTETTTGGGPTVSTSVEVGNTIVYAFTNQTATISCEQGKSLNVTGGKNTLTVTGTCESVSVGGTKNNITIDKVNTKITVLGMDNTITYKDGDPKVSNVGHNNTVTKGG